jgi:pimeloyl-ACP methyl ester carboxylesterase
VGRIEEGFVEVDGVRVFVRRIEGDGPPIVFAHGNPTHSADWLPFLERARGPAIAFDLPGWGASASPKPGEFGYTMTGLGRFYGRALDALGVDQYSLVVHDWGGLALIAAQEHPDRVRRLVVINTVPLLPGYRWHWIARYFWRVRGAGELFNAGASKPALRLLSRQVSPRAGRMPDEFVEMIWRHWGPGAWRPMLVLYRSADPDRLAAAGARLADLECPALVLWGDRDVYIPVEWGRAYADRLPNAELIEFDRAGHWPWLDRPELIDRAVDFLDGG